MKTKKVIDYLFFKKQYVSLLCQISYLKNT